MKKCGDTRARSDLAIHRAAAFYERPVGQVRPQPGFGIPVDGRGGAMQDEPFTRLDLNLLAIFDAIMSERSLTKAGHRLGMTQSAVSHSLARLREVTGDTLFERTGRGVRPTQRALSMSGDVREALDRLRATLRPRSGGFCSKSTQRTFLLDIPAGIDSIIAPALAQRAVDSEGLSFRISGGRAKAIMQELRFGETWLALDYERPEAEGYRFEHLFEDPFVIISRRAMPRLPAR
ncbi:MAG: LysR family transcriptional regulator [Sphingomonadales bacterium]|nr:LysR family transcriptional regulator [Sphingomonadales bacterium]